MWEVPAERRHRRPRRGTRSADTGSTTPRSRRSRATRTCASGCRPSRSTTPTQSSERQVAVAEALADLTGARRRRRQHQLGRPVVGERDQPEGAAARSIFFLVAITIYITFRFEFKMASRRSPPSSTTSSSPSASTRSFGFEVTPATVIALLTILGYSIYDGIVVFDKVDENTRLVSATGADDVRRHGQPVAQPDADAVAQHVAHRAAADHLAAGHRLVRPRGDDAAGVRASPCSSAWLSGAYSSIFIASPLLAVLKEREPRYRDVRRRMRVARGRPPCRRPRRPPRTACRRRRARARPRRRPRPRRDRGPRTRPTTRPGRGRRASGGDARCPGPAATRPVGRQRRAAATRPG